MVLSVSSRRSWIFVLACALGTAAGTGRADTCSYNWDCHGSQQCAALMGGPSGTKTASGTMSIYTVAGDPSSIRTVPVNQATCEQALRVIGLSYPCTCTPGDTPGATASNGFQLKSTGSATGDVVNDAAQLWILQNIKNPYTMTFAQNFTQSFLTSYIQGQKQREAIEASIQQQQEQQAEQAREAEQQRISAMFARLNSELKLSGIDTQLQLKTGGDPTQLAMKLSGSGSDGLAFKLGGTPSSPAAAPPPPDPASETGGLKLKLGDEPPAGSAAASDTTASASPAPAMGIPGLPGIYLNDIPPAKSPEVAAAALSMNGQERDIAEDAALQAAEKNPALTVPSDDPFVQDFQQREQEYADAEKARQAALDKAAEAQGHVQADQTALNYANGLAQTSGATEPQSQAMARLQAVVGEEEDMAAAAQVGFDKAGAEATVKREEAAISLASLAPPATQTEPGALSFHPAADEPVRDALSASPVTKPAGSTPFFGSTAARPAASTPQAASPVPAGSGLPVIDPAAKPQLFAHPDLEGRPYIESVGECMARTANLQPGSAVPSLEDLKRKLEAEKAATERVERDWDKNKDISEDWRKQWHDAFEDVRMNMLDKAVEAWFSGTQDGLQEEEIELHGEIQETNQQARELRQELEEARQAMAGAKGDPQKLAALQKQWDDLERTQAGPLIAWRNQVEQKWSDLFTAKKRMDSFTSARDFALWVTDNEVPCKVAEGKINCDAFVKENNPIAKDGKYDETASLDGIKQVVKFAAHNAEYLKYLKYVPLAVKVAENASFVGETWDALSFATDMAFDGTAIYLSYQRLQQVQVNNEQFARARQLLGERMDRLNAEIGCYRQAGAGASAEATR